MNKRVLWSVMAVCCLSSAQAEVYTGPHNFSKDEYVIIRSLQICINRQGFDYDQEHNDNLLKDMLKEQGINFSFAKLMRENYKYEHGVRGSIKAVVDYEIDDAVKQCMLQELVPPYEESDDDDFLS